MKDLLVETSYPPHLDAWSHHPVAYPQMILENLRAGYAFSTPVKGVILAVALHQKKYLFAQHLLIQYYTLPEVLKTCELLDGHRYFKSLEKHLARLATSRAFKQAPFKSALDRKKQQQMAESPLRLNSSQINFLKKNWVHQQTAAQLESFALTFPTQGWRELADYLHLAPYDFQLDWFLSFVFGTPAPETSIVSQIQQLTPETLTTLITEQQPNYPYLRTLLTPEMKLTPESKDEIANYESLGTLLWYWEELATPYTQEVMLQRIEAGEKIELSYGKLMERLMLMESSQQVNPKLRDYLYQQAKQMLGTFRLNLESPVLVLGDASASMQVAVKTSSIIASIIGTLCDARLHLFRNDDQEISPVPSTASEVIHFGLKCQACRSTNPSISFIKYFAEQIPMKTIVVVTDEYENGKVWIQGQCHNFAQLYRRYYQEVSPARLVFITFKNSDYDAPMVRDLRHHAPELMEQVTVFRMDPNRPDLTKLDGILAQLSGTSQEAWTAEQLEQELAFEHDWHVVKKPTKKKIDLIENLVIDL